LSSLREADEPSHRAITERFVTWDNVDVVRGDDKVSVRGNRFAGLARVAFLDVLHRRCAELGVEIQYHRPLGEVSELPPAGLLVGADGARSMVRRTYEAELGPSLDVRKNRYIWLGTPRLFDGLTLTFRESEHGLFVAHSYKFDGAASTFIVEAVGDAWAKAGFAAMTPDETRAYLGRVFAPDLQGAPLLTNNFVKWLSFVIVKNARWHRDHAVVLGDALHTAHFSIGSGTKAALEDAIALARAFADAGDDVPGALALFERTRKPVVDALQAAAHSSLVWFEEAASRMHLSSLDLAYDLMTRSGRIHTEKLRRRARRRAGGGGGPRRACPLSLFPPHGRGAPPLGSSHRRWRWAGTRSRSCRARWPSWSSRPSRPSGRSTATESPAASSRRAAT